MAIILPRQLQDIIDSPITPGNRHAWLLRIAGFLIELDPKGKVLPVLTTMAEMIGKPESAHSGELQRIIDFHLEKRTDTPPEYRMRSPRLPKCDKVIELLLRIFDPPFDQTTKAIADEAILKLFSPDEILCYSSDLFNAMSASSLELAKFASTMQFITPNPISCPEGVRAKDKIILRGQINVAYRKYLVAEFDDPKLPSLTVAEIKNTLNSS